MQSLHSRSLIALTVISTFLFVGVVVAILRLTQEVLSLWLWASVLAYLGVTVLLYAIVPVLLPLLFRARWIDPADLPPELAAHIAQGCAEKGIPIPRLGLIRESEPDAVSWGYTPRHARLLLTTAALSVPDDAGVKLVLSKELHRIARWRIVTQTLLPCLVPWLAYLVVTFLLQPRLSAIFGTVYTCYLTMIAPLGLGRLDPQHLLQQARLLDEAARSATLDPRTVALLQSAIARDVSSLPFP